MFPTWYKVDPLPGRCWPIRTDERGEQYQDTKYGRAYYLNPEVPDREPVAQEELEELPEGSPILVLWRGGRGPVEYLLRKTRYGRPYAAVKKQPEVMVSVLGEFGRDVGNQHHNTKVWTMKKEN